MLINQIRNNIEKNLEKFLELSEKKYKLSSIHPALYEYIKDFCLRGGKRIRPLLLILSYKGYLAKNQRVHASIYQASTCTELLHNFMLVHDDIIDNSSLRRGKPTMHKLLESIADIKDKTKLGSDLAIITGDILYALAIDAFLTIKVDDEQKNKALQYFVQTATFTAMGEFLDTLHGIEPVDKIKEEDIFLNYTLKTSKYTFDAPLVIGALLANAPKTEIKKLSQLSLLIGQAFQIQDDIIGLFDTERNIGKSILSDLEEKKKTILIYHAYKTLKGTDKNHFLKIFNKERNTMKDLENIKNILIKTKSLEYSINEVLSRFDEGFMILNKLKLNSEIKDIFINIFKDFFRPCHEMQKKYIPKP